MARWVCNPQIGVAAIQPLFTALGRRGADVPGFCAGLGLEPSVARDPDARIPLRQLDAIWNRAAALTGDAHLGLHLGESVSADSFGLLSYLGASCATWGDALRKVFGYFRLLSEGSAYHLTTDDDRAVVTATQDAVTAEPVRHRVEFTIAVVHGYGRRFVAGDWLTSDVFFEHPRPDVDDLQEHARVFGRLPRFAAGGSGFAFPAALLDRPLVTSDPGLAAVLDRVAARLLADEPDPTRLSHQVRCDLLRVGLHGQVSLEAVARRLGMSPRTLQRRLRDEETSHHEVLEQVRRAVATRMLAGSDTGIAEVACAVGFSEPAAFHRAFKRWTGRTPSEFRRAEGRRRVDGP
jgi:AraC-like DNA-binding protein